MIKLAGWPTFKKKLSGENGAGLLGRKALYYTPTKYRKYRNQFRLANRCQDATGK